MAIMKIISESEILPMELAEIKQFLKIDYEDESEDLIVTRSFKSAIKQCELMIGKSIIEKKYQYSFYNQIEKCVKLIYGPVVNIDKIKIIKKNNQEILLNEDCYFFDDVSDKIYFKSNYPNDYYRLDVLYNSKTKELSDDLKQAILFHTTKIFEDKTGYCPIPKASYNIYKKYKTQRL